MWDLDFGLENMYCNLAPIMEYINPKDQNHPVMRRRLWLHPFGTETYNQSSQFFDELIELTATGKMIRIDHNYYNKVINGK